jgi:hypothetical protein
MPPAERFIVMTYAHINPIIWWWRRRRLEAAIASASTQKSKSSIQRVLNALTNCPLFVAVREVPDIPTDEHGRITTDVHISTLTSNGPDGKALLVFTSKDHLRRRSSTAGAIILHLEDVINILPEDCAGIVLNPASHCVFLARESIDLSRQQSVRNSHSQSPPTETCDKDHLPVDLDQPIENPSLVTMIDAFAVKPDQQHLRRLLSELNHAVFLVVTLLDEAKMSSGDTPGLTTFEKGSLIKLLEFSGPSGGRALPLFTDWKAIRAWTDQEVSAFVMPANQAWSFALENYEAAVVNPAGPSLPLDRQQIAELARMLKSE